MRILELAGGIVILMLGFWLWLRLFLMDVSTRGRPDSSDIVPFLMLVAPGFVVALGCYLQSIHRKPWAFGVALIGMLGTLIVMGINARFVFGYIGDHLGLRVVWADLLALGITFIAVCVQTLRDNPPRPA